MRNIHDLPKYDLETLIANAPVGAFHVRVVLLCALMAMLDGFDTQAIAFIAPEISTAWNVPATSFGAVFGAGLLGGLVGALGLSAAGDRFGRKPLLILATLIFSIGSLSSTLSNSLSTLAVSRFFTGIGLGGALPAVMALTAEYAPQRWRTSVVGWMFCGFPFGAVVGGFAAAKFIPALGWRSVFIAGGMLPLVLLPFVALMVPESPRFLHGETFAITRLVRAMRQTARWNGTFASPVELPRTRFGELFSDRRATGTLMLWATLFLSLLLTYFLVNWIPLVARQAGLPIQAAVIAVAMLNLGAIVGCVVIVVLADRLGTPTLPIGIAFALGSAAIALIGQVALSPLILCCLTFLVGALSIGAQMGTVALCANFYPTALRATGIGWAMGLGRVGAIAGPIFGGQMLKAGVPLSHLFLTVGAISLLAAGAVAGLARYSGTGFARGMSSLPLAQRRKDT